MWDELVTCDLTRDIDQPKCPGVGKAGKLLPACKQVSGYCTSQETSASELSSRQQSQAHIQSQADLG